MLFCSSYCSHSKTVTLLPPAATQLLSPLPAYAATSNHSTLSPAAVDALAPTVAGALRVTVPAGCALYIPEGWWHQVQSTAGTVAVNVWYKGTRAALLEQPSSSNSSGSDTSSSGDSRQHYLRCIVHSLLHERRAAAAAARRLKAEASAAATTASSSVVDVMALSPAERTQWLRIATFEQMRSALPVANAEHPAEWCSVLLNLDSETADAVTTVWSEAAQAVPAEELTQFYADIGLTEQHTAALFKLTEAHAKAECAALLQSVLGPL
jgi:Cupin-like domain